MFFEMQCAIKQKNVIANKTNNKKHNQFSCLLQC